MGITVMARQISGAVTSHGRFGSVLDIASRSRSQVGRGVVQVPHAPVVPASLSACVWAFVLV